MHVAVNTLKKQSCNKYTQLGSAKNSMETAQNNEVM